MNQQLWIMILMFLATAATLATQMLPVSPSLMPFLFYAVAVINAALGIFFGVTGFKVRAAAKAVKAAQK